VVEIKYAVSWFNTAFIVDAHGTICLVDDKYTSSPRVSRVNSKMQLELTPSTIDVACAAWGNRELTRRAPITSDRMHSVRHECFMFMMSIKRVACGSWRNL
jgi:hypothetical protein